MKIKKIILLLSSIFCSCILSEAKEFYPVFSTEENPVWYFIKFNSGSSCISDSGNGQTLSAKPIKREDALLWQFIGNRDCFLMKSKLGNYVFFKGERYYSGSQKNGLLKFIMSPCFNAMGGLEIQQKGNTRTSMNRKVMKEEGNRIELGEAGTGNGNNILSVIAASAPVPEFSDKRNDCWYYLQSKEKMTALEDAGIGKEVCMSAPNTVASQLWKITGSKDNFQLVSKEGHYLFIEKSMTTADKEFPGGFHLSESNRMEYLPAWSIIPNRSSESDGHPAETPPLLFISPEKMDFNEFTIKGSQNFLPENPLTLWYRKPATLGRVPDKWMEYSLPLGNGHFGASIYGGVWKDEIQFNEKSLWSGGPDDNAPEFGDYENFGSVFAEELSTGVFSFDTTKPVTDYVRGLDLHHAKAFVTFCNSDRSTHYSREYFTSNPAGVLVARYRCSGKDKLNLRFTLESGKPGIDAPTRYHNGSAGFSGKLETVSFCSFLKIIPQGGKMTTDEKGIEVRNAGEIMVILGGCTDFDAYSPTFTSKTEELSSIVKNKVETAAGRTWNCLYEEHCKDYKDLFDRCSLHLDGAANHMATDEMIDEYAKRKNGTEADALMLEQLYFSYGRYLEIASSRDLALPSNLQGIWNNFSKTIWHADIHSNINVQMNYWPAEPANLSETHLPFLDYIINMSTLHDQWKKHAQEAGQQEGWTCFIENNIFGGVGAFFHKYVIANAWYCTHLWQHYRYTLDKEFLKRAFPAMWSASRFWITRLVKAEDGSYECPEEWSPEQGPVQNGIAHAQQIVWELLDNTLSACKELGDEAPVSAEQVAIHEDRLEKMDKGLAVEIYDGSWGSEINGIKTGDRLLKEWKYSPYSRGQKGHRHVSHLMGLYPLNQITASSPYFQPAVNSLKLRGDASTGWSMGWKICLWARAADGNHAHSILELALRHHEGRKGGIYYNLFDSHPPFQIDGNFGACAGMAEMLMQSYSGTIRILPALPEVWQKGNIKGLKAVNNFTVDIEWDHLQPTKVKITSHKGMPLSITYKDIADQEISVNGKIVRPAGINSDKLEIETRIGDKITITFNR